MGSSVPLMYGASGLPSTDGQLRFSITITKTVCILPGRVTPAVWAKLASVLVKLKNRSWPSVKGSPLAPYINGTLLPIGAHAERYYKPHGASSSLPIYLWMEAGGSV